MQSSHGMRTLQCRAERNRRVGPYRLRKCFRLRPDFRSTLLSVELLIAFDNDDSRHTRLPLPDCRCWWWSLTGQRSGLWPENISLHDTIQVIPGFFRLTHVENRGAAFGLFADSPSEWKIAALVLFSIVALAIVSVLLWRNSHSMQQHRNRAGADSWRRHRQSLGPPAQRTGRRLSALLRRPISVARFQRGRQRDRHRRRLAGDRNPLRKISRAGKVSLIA